MDVGDVQNRHGVGLDLWHGCAEQRERRHEWCQHRWDPGCRLTVWVEERDEFQRPTHAELYGLSDFELPPLWAPVRQPFPTISDLLHRTDNDANRR